MEHHDNYEVSQDMQRELAINLLMGRYGYDKELDYIRLVFGEFVSACALTEAFAYLRTGPYEYRREVG